MKITVFGGAMALVSMSSAALAGDNVAVQPIQVGSETVRFNQGVPTLDLQLPHGAVQVTPLAMDHGGLAFGVAVLNTGDQPANFDITSLDVHAGQQALPVFSREQLEAKAKKRAMWASIALAAVGGLSAAAAASQRDYYQSTLVTPRGTYRATYSAPSTAGQIQAAAITAGTGVGIASIQSALDQTRAALGASTVQLTTVNPGEGYGGRVVLPKIKNKALPQRVDMVVRWNGENYAFAFQLAKRGTPAPVFTALTAPPAPGHAAPAPAPAPVLQPTAPDTHPLEPADAKAAPPVTGATS